MIIYGSQQSKLSTRPDQAQAQVQFSSAQLGGIGQGRAGRGEWLGKWVLEGEAGQCVQLVKAVAAEINLEFAQRDREEQQEEE